MSGFPEVGCLASLASTGNGKKFEIWRLIGSFVGLKHYPRLVV